MAYSNSNSSSSSYHSAVSQPALGLIRLLRIVEQMEDMFGQQPEPSRGFAWTLSNASEVSFSSGASTATEASSKSQVTITPPESMRSGYQATIKTGLFPKVPNHTTPRYGGLEPDKEGKETRDEMLKRRRKACSVEEVDVALAPVLKLNIPYVFYPEQYKAFRKMFPRVNTDSGLSFVHHDHPVAHTATMVGMRYMQTMLRPGERVIDLHGNPTGNESFNRFQAAKYAKRVGLPTPPVIATMVEKRSAMDFVRSVTKWGDQYGSDGKMRWFESTLDELAPGCCDTFFSVNTLYYYTMYEVCKLLNKNPGTKLVALVNYSPEQSGTLYNGELKFSKNNGMTVQTSPNGEKYIHPDIDQWFQTNSFRGLTETIDTGISWTSQCIGGPLYVLTITSCDWSAARNKRYDPPAAPTLAIQDGRSMFGIVKIGGQSVRLRITNNALASELRHWMTFRDRSNPDTFADLCVKARRATGKDLIEGSRQYEVADGDLQDHIIYAYLVDAPGEVELLNGVKMLKGDLLLPLAQNLKFEGKVDKTPWTSFLPLNDVIWGRARPKDAFGKSVKPMAALSTKDKQNTGGLIPIVRT